MSSTLSLRPASVFDMQEALDDLGRPQRLRRRQFARFARQIAGGMSVTLRDQAGALVCVVGLWPEPDYLELWFAAGPALHRNLFAVVRTLKRLHVLAMDGELVREIRAFIHPDSVAGGRLATLFGFTASVETSDANGRQYFWYPDQGRKAGPAQRRCRPGPAATRGRGGRAA